VGVTAWDERLGQGELIGLTDTERYSYLACHGLPCPIVATTPDGRQRTIAGSAGVATLVGGDMDSTLWYEAVAAHGRVALHRLVVASGRDRTIKGIRLRLAWPGRWIDGAVEAPVGAAVLTRDGAWSGPEEVQLASVSTSGILRLQSLREVSR
jgi:hypothetical protein